MLFSFSLDQIILEPGPKKHLDVGVEAGAKKIDAWSWSQSRSLKFAFRFHSPADSAVRQQLTFGRKQVIERLLPRS